MSSTFHSTQGGVVSESTTGNPTLLVQNENFSDPMLPTHIASGESKTRLHKLNQNTAVVRRELGESLEKSGFVFKTDGKSDRQLGFVQGFRRLNKKPWVILLGRENSFSLGRSEVMLIHTKRDIRQSGPNVTYDRNKLVGDSLGNYPRNNINNQFCGNLSKKDSALLAFSGLSDGVRSGCSSNVVTDAVLMTGCNGTVDCDEVPTDYNVVTDILEAVWQKTELIMAAKEERVVQILAEYGIGSAGGGDGSQDMIDKSAEEEKVWQAVEVSVDRMIAEEKLWQVVEIKVNKLINDTKVWNTVGVNVDRKVKEENIWKIVEAKVDRMDKNKKKYDRQCEISLNLNINEMHGVNKM
uniref:Uncharacterized protein n=1 Tax=Arion vulgaris TaxID=1028688 RepID=A0A0B6YV78_9EUPU